MGSLRVLKPPIWRLAFPGLRIRRGEAQRFGDIGVPAAADHQKFAVHGAHALDGAAEILHQDDVAIDVTEQLMPRDGLGPGEKIVQALGAQLVARDVRLVAKSEFLRDFGGAFVVAKENDFDLGMKGFPGLQRVALNDADMGAEGFRGGEEGQHEGCFRLPCGGGGRTLERLNVERWERAFKRWNVSADQWACFGAAESGWC